MSCKELLSVLREFLMQGGQQQSDKIAAAFCDDESDYYNLEMDILQRCAQGRSVTNSSDSSRRSKSFVPRTTLLTVDYNYPLNDKTCDWSSEASLSLRVGTAPSEST